MLPKFFAFLMADIQRAQAAGFRTMEVSLSDLTELMPLAESGAAKAKAAQPMKHAGWIRPGDLRNLRANGAHSVRIKRKSSPRSNMEVFFCGNIKEKELESLELVRLALEEEATAQALKAEKAARADA